MKNSEFKKFLKVLSKKTGEFFVDTGLKILFSIVIGSVVLTGTYSLAKDGVLENVETKVENLFDYNGGSEAAPKENPTDDDNKTITFSIEGVGTYEADEGMTWAEWIMSYAMSSSSNGIVWIQDGTLELYVNIGNGLWENDIQNQHCNDVIIDGATYSVGGPT